MLKSAVKPISNRLLNAQILRFAGVSYGKFLDMDAGRVSVDMLRFCFSYKLSKFDYHSSESMSTINAISRLIDLRALCSPVYTCEWSYCDNFRIGRYARTCRIYNLDWSFAIMLGRYCYDTSCKLVAPEVVIDFNPNKVPDDVISSFWLMLRAECLDCRLLRFDVAFDFPFHRSDIYMLPSSRCTNRNFESTQYYGTRHKHGSVKLYDKQLESNLPVPVTRLEVTIEGSRYKSIEDVFPSLFCLTAGNIDFGFYDLPFEVQACVMYPDLLPVLKRSVSPNTYRKFSKMIADTSFAPLTFDYSAVDSFISSVFSSYMDGVYINGL